MKAFNVVFALLIAMWVSILVGFVWYESKHPCLQYEDKLVHHDEVTIMQPIDRYQSFSTTPGPMRLSKVFKIRQSATFKPMAIRQCEHNLVHSFKK